MLIYGDCIEQMARLADNSVDMVLCDLPYGTTNCPWDVLIPFEPLWMAYRRVAKPNAAIVLMAQAPFDKVLACSNLQDFRYEWVWHKTEASGHLNARRAPMKAHEVAMVFSVRSHRYFPQKTTGHQRK